MTHQVITRWYRPPELLFGARHYAGAVDIWSVGLVFAELILRIPFLPGHSDVHQLDLIGQNIGTPTERHWPGVSRLPDYVAPGPDRVRPVRGRDYYLGLFGSAGPLGVDLLMGTLALDPRRRPTAQGFLDHDWWTADPRPTPKADLPTAGTGAGTGDHLKRRDADVPADHGPHLRPSKVARKLDFSRPGR